MKLLFATQNQNKVKEINLLLGPHIEMQSLADLNDFEELEETSLLLHENALQKARQVFEKYKVNCFSEDTGLEIESLDGAPGALSARYAGEEKSADKNMDKVLSKMNGKQNRSAQFCTVIAFIINGKEFLFEGKVNGQITESKRGTGGFGYDPVFQPDGFGKTFAEMNATEKSTISHRARAFNKMKKFLESEFTK